MIIFENVTKSFNLGGQRKVILDRASFTIQQGQPLGILAPNGTGKTTVINMMAGLERPDEGAVRRTSRVSFPLGHMGGINSKLTGSENARRAAQLYRYDPDMVESFATWMSDLGPHMHMPAGTWSTGTRARFSFSLMLAFEFDFYLIDEGMPTTTDVAFNKRAMDVLQQRLSRGTAVIVSHMPEVIEKFCGRASVLKHGVLTHYQDLETAREAYEYKAA
ncbi:MAG: ATP-binding cassette domain-containing protein [Roseibium sp.]|uniref:ABC transporter ATP-binding protein n=1 Tax=Roseibium sp. TaxID=1936156 RepID=UPI00329A5CDC